MKVVVSKMKNPFTQLCVWPGTLVDEDEIPDFINFFKEEFDVRVKYKCQVETLPDMENGIPVEGTGGRSDVFFYVHSDDIMKFVMPRMQLGVKWWEDMIKYNDYTHLYTEEFLSENPATW